MKRSSQPPFWLMFGAGGMLSALIGWMLVLITGMTVRTDLQVQSLTFTASAGRRDVIEVSISLAYMPRPGVLGKLLELGNVAVRTLGDFTR